jgi:hypothetical protein
VSGDGDRAAVLWDQHADAVYAYARRRVGASAHPARIGGAASPSRRLPPQNFVAVYDPLRDVWESLLPPGPQALGGSPVAAQRRIATFALEGTDTRLVAHIFDPRRREHLLVYRPGW